MQQYSFTLEVAGIDTDPDIYEGVLYKAGCDDALIALIGDHLYLDFDRKRSSYDEAVGSAMRDVEKAGGRVVAVSPITDDAFFL